MDAGELLRGRAEIVTKSAKLENICTDALGEMQGVAHHAGGGTTAQQRSTQAHKLHAGRAELRMKERPQNQTVIAHLGRTKRAACALHVLGV